MAAVCTLAAGSQPQVNMLLLLAPGYLRPTGLGEYILTHHEQAGFGSFWSQMTRVLSSVQVAYKQLGVSDKKHASFMCFCSRLCIANHE